MYDLLHMLRNKVFAIDTKLLIKAHNESDAAKRAIEALRDGLIEPGFIENGSGVLEGSTTYITQLTRANEYYS